MWTLQWPTWPPPQHPSSRTRHHNNYASETQSHLLEDVPRGVEEHPVKRAQKMRWKTEMECGIKSRGVAEAPVAHCRLRSLSGLRRALSERYVLLHQNCLGKSCALVVVWVVALMPALCHRCCRERPQSPWCRLLPPFLCHPHRETESRRRCHATRLYYVLCGEESDGKETSADLYPSAVRAQVFCNNSTPTQTHVKDRNARRESSSSQRAFLYRRPFFLVF